MLIEPRLHTAISLQLVLRVISVHKLELCTTPTCCCGELRKTPATTAPYSRHEHGELDPDLFMKRRDGERRVDALQSLRRTRLHDKYGRAFEKAYRYEERVAKASEAIRKIPRHNMAQDAVDALRDRHPWITFKDPCNLRSPQQHAACASSTCAPR